MSIDDKKPQRQYMTVKIPKPRNVERIFYILIIIALLFFLFVYNPFPQITCKSCTGEVTAAVVEDTNLEAAPEAAPGAGAGAAPEAVAEAAPVAEAEAVAEPEPEPKPKPKTSMSAASGEIKYSITKITTEIRFQGQTNEYGKIKEVKYKIENNDQLIEEPKVKVYAYDADSTTDEMNLIRGTVSLDSVSKGDVKEGTIKLKTGSFSNLAIDKTVRLRFYDGTKLLKTITDVIKIK